MYTYIQKWSPCECAQACTAVRVRILITRHLSTKAKLQGGRFITNYVDRKGAQFPPRLGDCSNRRAAISGSLSAFLPRGRGGLLLRGLGLVVGAPVLSVRRGLDRREQSAEVIIRVQVKENIDVVEARFINREGCCVDSEVWQYVLKWPPC